MPWYQRGLTHQDLPWVGNPDSSQSMLVSVPVCDHQIKSIVIQDHRNKIISCLIIDNQQDPVSHGGCQGPRLGVIACASVPKRNQWSN